MSGDRFNLRYDISQGEQRNGAERAWEELSHGSTQFETLKVKILALFSTERTGSTGLRKPAAGSVIQAYIMGVPDSKEAK